jgi:hypothetical protein
VEFTLEKNKISQNFAQKMAKFVGKKKKKKTWHMCVCVGFKCDGVLQ